MKVFIFNAVTLVTAVILVTRLVKGKHALVHFPAEK